MKRILTRVLVGVLIAATLTCAKIGLEHVHQHPEILQNAPFVGLRVLA